MIAVTTVAIMMSFVTKKFMKIAIKTQLYFLSGK